MDPGPSVLMCDGTCAPGLCSYCDTLTRLAATRRALLGGFNIAAAATPQDTKSSAGSGCDGDPGRVPTPDDLAGEGPHDAIGDPCGGSAEGALPAPKDARKETP